MKACIIVFSSIASTPFLYKYIDIFQQKNVVFDIIHWDRYNYNEEVCECDKMYTYKKEVPDSASFFVKLFPMLSFSLYSQRILKNNDYDIVVVLTSLIGVLLEKFLRKFYKNKYIFDIRDHSYEHIAWYKKKMTSMVENSALNIISSNGFRNFLPKSSYSIMHNCTYKKSSVYKFTKSNKLPIKIFFVGAIRYGSEIKKFINVIANNPLYEFYFYGRGSDEAALKNFCLEEKINNVRFMGAYEPKEKDNICQQADILYNAYGDDLHVKYAMSNKYYDALYHKKPLIVNTDTSMAESSKGFSFELDYSKNVSADELRDWYFSLDERYSDKLANEYLSKVLKDNLETYNKIINLLIK